MKLLHLSDLHLGKTLGGYSLLEDQEHILGEVINIVEQEKPDGVLLAGDIYDTAAPPARAVSLLDSFLSSLKGKDCKIFLTSGNHDSDVRLAFAKDILRESGFYISPPFKSLPEPLTFQDSYGEIRFYLLPYLTPAIVRNALRAEGEDIKTFTGALRAVIEALDVDETKRNVLVCHQFVTGAETSDSETFSVGGSDNVDASVFRPFDYVALGHIHKPQHILRETVRYSGAPLKYSFSEARQVKSATIADLREKGTVEIRAIPLLPLCDMRELKGTYRELMSRDYYEGKGLEEAYTHITLTDEDEVDNAFAKLQSVYRKLMKLDYDNGRLRLLMDGNPSEAEERKSPLELFKGFFRSQRGKDLEERQVQLVESLIEAIAQEDK